MEAVCAAADTRISQMVDVSIRPLGGVINHRIQELGYFSKITF